MKRALKPGAINAVSAVLIVLTAWAASYTYGAAHRSLQSERRAAIPYAARFRAVEGRGLLVRAWVNGRGAYNFAIDTGAGATILSERVAQEAQVAIKRGSRVSMSGLSGVSSANATGREALVRELALGDVNNLLPTNGAVIVSNALPPDIDGVLDPSEAYWPLGFVIDLPRGEISAFNPRTNPLRLEDVPPGGAVVPWLMQGGSRRPFVTLDGGRRALIDTGSGFGLAVTRDAASALGLIPREGREQGGVRDLAGGSIQSQRIAPATVRVGALELRSIPTDLLSGVAAGSPILLGREALAPFRLTFDPQRRLIQFAPQ